MDTSQRRAYFRVTYPLGKNPILRINGREFLILDMGEMGVRFANPKRLIVPEDLLRATIQLGGGKTLQISGRVVRVQGNRVSLSLVKGIPFSVILAEQAALRRMVQEGQE